MNWLVNLFQSVIFQTVISGVLLFILSQYILKFVIEPLQEYKKTIARIDNKLKFYANILANPGITSETNQSQKDKYLECYEVFRSLSCELEVNYKQISFVRGIIKSKEKISEAASCLMGLSNGIFRSENLENNNNFINKIRDNLNIPKL